MRLQHSISWKSCQEKNMLDAGISTAEHAPWMLKVQAGDKPHSGQWHVGSFMREKINKLLIMYISSPSTPQPSVSSYFCTHLTLSVSFRHALTNQRDDFYWHLQFSPDGCISETYVWHTLVWKQSQVAKWWFRNYWVKKEENKKGAGRENWKTYRKEKLWWHTWKVRNANFNSQIEKSKIYPASFFTA